MGRPRRSTADKPKKRKKVTVQLIREKHAGEITEPYRLLSEIRSRDHAHLAEAKIGLAWRMGWRTDTDGHMRLGQCRKRGDLDRELDGFDFIILLNKEAWPALNEKQKRAVLDHELCHAQLSFDADGNPKYNDRDRLVCRVKKHDVEEFRAIVDRHGVWTQDLEAIAKAGINDAKRPLLQEVKQEVKQESAEAIASEATDGEEATTAATATADWRTLSIEVLGIAASRVKKLADASIETLGQFSDHVKQHGDFWYRDLRGFGEAAANDLQDRFADFWGKHPEFVS